MDSAVYGIASAIEHEGTKLNLEKCGAFVPQCDRAGGSEHPAISPERQARGGFPALGAAYSRDYESIWGAFSVAADSARKLLSAAKEVLRSVHRSPRKGILLLQHKQPGLSHKKLHARRCSMR